MMFGYRIDAELELRIVEARHASDLFALIDRNREYLREWLTWVDETKSVEDSRAHRVRMLRRFADGEEFTFGLYERGELIGMVGLHVNEGHCNADIGYWLSEDRQGRGLITRACRAVIGLAFHDLRLHRVFIHCAAGNARSRAVPRRLGFREEAALRESVKLHGRFVDVVLYGMLATEWDSKP